jgi:hypothetical protein
LSISTVAFFAFGRKSVFGAGFAHKVLGVNKQNLAASVTLLKVFFKAHILNDERMELGGLIDARYNFLSKDCADVISRIGFVVLFVDDVGNIRVLDFVNFQVKDFLLSFR